MKHSLLIQIIIALPYAVIKASFSISAKFEQYALPEALGVVILGYIIAVLLCQWIPFLMAIIIFKIPKLKALHWNIDFWIPLLIFYTTGILCAVFFTELDRFVIPISYYLDGFYIFMISIFYSILSRKQILLLVFTISAFLWLIISFFFQITGVENIFLGKI